jgi:hypothetical protein
MFVKVYREARTTCIKEKFHSGVLRRLHGNKNENMTLEIDRKGRKYVHVVSDVSWGAVLNP